MISGNETKSKNDNLKSTKIKSSDEKNNNIDKNENKLYFEQNVKPKKKSVIPNFYETDFNAFEDVQKSNNSINSQFNSYSTSTFTNDILNKHRGRNIYRDTKIKSQENKSNSDADNKENE